MIDAERNDTETHYNASVWTACGWSVEIAFGISKTRRIPYLLNHRWLCYPIYRSGWQHRKDLEEENRGLDQRADWPRRAGKSLKHFWYPLINPGG
jgi:hypothetical protein